jgi:hypothetical protein
LQAAAIEVGSIDQHRALLLQFFEANRAIQSIRISGCWTEPHLKFCESLAAFRPDIDFRLSMNQTKIELILRVLCLCKSNRCSSISISDNRMIGDADGASLALALQSMSSLLYLNLSFNGIRDKDCHALASALQSMSSLQHLNLGWNNMLGDAGCRALAHALQSMSSLQH